MANEPPYLKKLNRLDQEIFQMEEKIGSMEEKLKQTKDERDVLEEKALLDILKRNKVGHKDLAQLLTRVKPHEDSEEEPTENSMEKPKEAIENHPSDSFSIHNEEHPNPTETKEETTN
ncbi:MAG: hypothetical protein R3Y63_16030 [Eubacteriales bacterium]